MSMKADWGPRPDKRGRGGGKGGDRDAAMNSGDPPDARRAAERAYAELDARARAEDPPMGAALPILLRHAHDRKMPLDWAFVLDRFVRNGDRELFPRFPWRRAGGDADPDARLGMPLADVDALELVAELAEGEGALAERARRVSDGWTEELQAELAMFVVGGDPERDLLAVRELVGARRARDASWLLAAAIAFRYGQQCRRTGGILIGPNGPRTLANACLAEVLWRLRIYPSLVPQLVNSIGLRRDGAGTWEMPDGQADLLTTAVAARVLASLDPKFDPVPTAQVLLRHRESDGTWHLDGIPEVWLTREIAAYLGSVDRPFAERFRWPGVNRLERDRRTSLPTPGYFDDVERAIGELGELKTASMDVAFVDLAGFGKFNNAFGQSKGDEVIAAFGRALARVELSRTVRDGGDEFVVMGTPLARGLEERMTQFGRDWAVEFRERFGTDVDAVAPRVIVAREQPAAALARVRERLGREIGQLKAIAGAIPPQGLVVALEERRGRGRPFAGNPG